MTLKRKSDITLEMIEFEYGYDNNVHGKVYFKCEHCGHKESKIL